MVTLLKKGNIIKEKWMTDIEKKQIDNDNSIEYILGFVKKRISLNAEQPKIMPKSLGYRVLIFESGTGSGKSTIIPTYLYKTFLKETKKTLLITQPKRLTTMEIPYQIIQYNKDIRLGKEIGYQTGVVSHHSDYGILFTTVGVLLQILKNNEDEKLMKYGFFIVDEAHERSIDLDVLLYMLKRFLDRNWQKPNCPLVILMSGTLNPGLYMKYFGMPKHNYLKVSGFSYPIKEFFPKFNVNDYLSYICYQIEQIHQNEEQDPFRDIMVFLQGKAQITNIIERVNKLNYEVFRQGLVFSKKHAEEKNIDNFWIKGGSEKPRYIMPIALMSENIKGGSYTALFSNLEDIELEIMDENGKVVEKATPYRRLVCATNSAETGLTIDTLKYCIDAGFVQDLQFDPVSGCSGLIERNVSKASSTQRRGRVGRKNPGEFYTCYSSKTRELFDDFNESEIMREDLTNLMLSIICTETNTTLEQTANTKGLHMKFSQTYYELKHENKLAPDLIDLIQYPSSDSMKHALEKLHCLGFIDNRYKPTFFGYFANKLKKIKLENIRVIFSGYHRQTSVLDLITMVSFASSSIVADRRKYQLRNPLGLSGKDVDEFNQTILDENIDYIFIYHEYIKKVEKIVQYIAKGKKIPYGYIEKWCEENHLSYYSLLAAIELRDEIIEDMLELNLNPFYNGLGLRPGRYNLVDLLLRDFDTAILEIKKMKKCILDGYRFNLCVRDKKVYRNVRNINVAIRSNIVKKTNGVETSYYPVVVPLDITIGKSQVPMTYEYYGNNISVLDSADETMLLF